MRGSVSASGSTAGEWRANWRVAIASTAGVAFTILHFYSLGVFLAPLSKAYGWSKSDITAAAPIISVINFFAAAAVGRLASRIGVRRVVLPGFIAYCCGLAALGLAGPSLWTWYALWFLFGLCYIFANNSLWSLAVARHFNRSRGLALAVALCGTGITSAIAPLAVSISIERFGWSATYGLLALTALLVGFPIIYFLLPGATPSARMTSAQVGTEALPGFTFREALKTRSFWILAFAAAVLGVGMPTLMLHFVSIGIHDHMSSRDAAAAAGFIGLAAIVGRLVTGLLMDTLPGRFVACVIFGVPALACLLLMNAHGSMTSMAVAAIVVGLCTGAEFDIIAVLVSRYLGMREFGAVNGQIAAIFGLGVGFGPAMGSIVFDHYGSYDQLLTGLAIAFFFPAALVLGLGKVRFPRQEPMPPEA